jgi:predicted ThiF/HesA family dinucleotide-utilizing enzyme
VSSKGGLCPKWRNDGKELFYIDGAKQIIAVDVIVRSSGLRIGEQRALFQARVGDGPAYSLNVTKDGNHFLVLERREQASLNLTLVLNWQRALVEQ